MIYTIIPNWNGADLIGACLESLQKQSIDHEIVVVDNGSVDESVEIIKQGFPGVTLLENAENLGFAGGVNVGIRYCLEQNAEYIALFNNDAVAKPDWLEQLVKTLKEKPQAGIATGKFMQMDKTTIDSTGDCYSVWGVPFPRGRGEEDVGQYDSPGQQEVLAATGGASLYRAEMLREVGLFDERFFAYYEDVDISFRAQLRGWRVMYQPKAVAYHHVGATSAQLGDFRLYHMYKNYIYLFLKNIPRGLFLSLGWRVTGTFGFKLLQLFKNLKFILAIRLIGEVLINTPAVLRSRWQIQRHKQVSTPYINSLLCHAPPPSQPTLQKVVKNIPFIK